MPDEVVISDSAMLCAAGTLEQGWQQLMAGNSALSPADLADLHCHVGRIADLPGELGSSIRLRALIGAGLGQLQLPVDATRMRLLVATTKGAADEPLQNYHQSGHGYAWQVAALISAELGGQPPATTVSAACASGTVALIQASQMIGAGEADQVLVVGVDILSRFVLAGFSQLQALAAGPCRPFDRQRDGLCLGEGIGLMLLTSRQQARRRGWPIQAAVKGWGVACDASHITAPCRQASGLTAAIRQATAHGRHLVGGINAHGTGTLYNDSMEIKALHNIWGASPPPFHSVKGALGHCLGAAGVIEACLAVRSLAAGKIPATVGLRQPEAFAGLVAPQPQQLTTPTLLSCNSGFGGINAALLFARKGAGQN